MPSAFSHTQSAPVKLWGRYHHHHHHQSSSSSSWSSSSSSIIIIIIFIIILINHHHNRHHHHLHHHQHHPQQQQLNLSVKTLNVYLDLGNMYVYFVQNRTFYTWTTHSSNTVNPKHEFLSFPIWFVSWNDFYLYPTSWSLCFVFYSASTACSCIVTTSWQGTFNKRKN